MIELLNSFRPDPDGLLRAISGHIDDEMLKEIAAADYGSRADEHLVALVQVRDKGTFPKEMYWCPCEVLELTRNAPQGADDDPETISVRGHWKRAFAATSLLRALHEPWNYGGDAAQPDYTLICLLSSLKFLPVSFHEKASSFLTWLLLNFGLEEGSEEVCYYGIGLLWLSLQLDTPPPDEKLIALAEWIVRREWELALTLRQFDGWLYGIGAGNPPPTAWKLIGVWLCEMDPSSHGPKLREWVSLIGLELAR